MENAKTTVMIGFIGTQLDGGRGNGRWAKWRPTVSMAQMADTPVQRMELFYGAAYRDLAEGIVVDMAFARPEIRVNLHLLDLKNPWDFGEVYAALFDWAQRYPFDPEHEDYWAHITTGTHVAQICLFLLVEARLIPGVLLQTSPPPSQRRNMREGLVGQYETIDLNLARYDALAQRLAQVQQDAVAYLKSGIATRNARFNALIDELERVAVRSSAPMLLTGPTGAGKSMLARRVYELRKARHLVHGGFVDVNCAMLRGDGAASTLFGHEKGAYTGAATARKGLLRTADQGVLFLDEIGELGPDEQAMLLKAIEDKRFLPVGADREVQSDFQLIAGTNRDLRAEVAAGRFREDLFARINVWSYALPGLNGRREDIEPNIDYQLALAGDELGRSVRFNQEARAAYLGFALSPEAAWHGNFRDLAASILRLATLAEQGRIGVGLVQAEIARLQWLWQNGTDDAAPATTSLSAQELLPAETLAALDTFDRLQLDAVLAVCSRHHSLSEAGRALFQVSRTRRSVLNDADRLRKYLARFGLCWEMLSRPGMHAAADAQAPPSASRRL